MKKAVVTGANGFIGSALCKELTSRGVEVIAIVRNKNATNIANIEHLHGVRIVCLDLSNFEKIADIITDRDVDVVYHLAWVGSSGPLRRDSNVQINNVRYTCDTVKACKKLNCKRFVFASSIMEYEIETVMATEITPEINSLYSSAKMARTIAGSIGMEYIRAVISNIYGPGEMSPRIINSSIRKMLRGERCIFSEGKQTYDFIYIDDAAKAFIAIGEKGVSNRTYYIGSQNPKPLKNFLCALRDQVDPSIEIGLGELPFNGISLTYKEFDIYAVKNDTGFIPEVEFAEGIRRTIEWIEEN